MKNIQTSNENKSLQKHQNVEDFLNKFIEFIDAKPKTIQTYKIAIKQFFRWTADNSINQPQRADILNYRSYLKETNKKPSTIQNYIIAIRQFFKWTASEGLYPNIAENIKGAKISREHKKDYLTSQQVKTVFNAVEKETLKGKRDYALLLLMTIGGLRTIEVVRANFEDLRTLGDTEVLFVQGKGRDEKTDYVKIPAQVSEAIRQYLTALQSTPKANTPLFSSISNHDKGQRITTQSISRIVKNRMIAAGYNSDKLTAHSLRHTAITLALLNGDTLQTVKNFARHSNITTTEIYAHNIDRLKVDCENTIAKAIFN